MLYRTDGKTSYLVDMHEDKSGLRIMTITDLDEPESITVTSAADKIIESLAASGYPMKDEKLLLLYRDHLKRWDEIALVDGKFNGFYCINAPTMAVAREHAVTRRLHKQE